MDVPSPIGRPEPAPEPAPYRDDAATTIKATIPFQPVPALTRVVHFKLFNWWVTAIMRHWNPADSQRCRLCRTCMAYENGCLTVVRGKVSQDQAGLLSIAGLKVQEPAT